MRRAFGDALPSLNDLMNLNHVIMIMFMIWLVIWIGGSSLPRLRLKTADHSELERRS